MKDPYAPGFWCSVTILGTLTASYFYGIRQTQQMNQAVHFLYAAAAVTVAVVLVALTWIAWQQLHLNKREVIQGRTLLTIWNTKVALRRVETVFDRYFWGSYWHSGRTFQEFMGELTGTPLEKSLEALKIQCLKLDKALPSDDRQWLETARELADVAAAMARERYQLDYSDVSFNSVGETCIDHGLEVLVYTWSASLKSFDHQLDEIDRRYAQPA